MEINYANAEALARYKANQQTAAAAIGDLPLLHARHNATGYHSRTDLERAKEGVSASAFETPAPLASKLRLFEEHLKRSSAMRHFADAEHNTSRRPAAASSSASRIPASSPSRYTPRHQPVKREAGPAVKKDVRFAAHTSPVSSDHASQYSGPCPECCLSHNWESCPRNAAGRRPNPTAFPHLGHGPHYRATHADIDAVLAKYGKIGVDATPLRVNSSLSTLLHQVSHLESLRRNAKSSPAQLMQPKNPQPKHFSRFNLDFTVSKPSVYLATSAVFQSKAQSQIPDRMPPFSHTTSTSETSTVSVLCAHPLTGPLLSLMNPPSLLLALSTRRCVFTTRNQIGGIQWTMTSW